MDPNDARFTGVFTPIDIGSRKIFILENKKKHDAAVLRQQQALQKQQAMLEQQKALQLQIQQQQAQFEEQQRQSVILCDGSANGKCKDQNGALSCLQAKFPGIASGAIDFKIQNNGWGNIIRMQSMYGSGEVETVSENQDKNVYDCISHLINKNSDPYYG
jgi:hypothetical protein